MCQPLLDVDKFMIEVCLKTGRTQLKQHSDISYHIYSDNTFWSSKSGIPHWQIRGKVSAESKFANPVLQIFICRDCTIYAQPGGNKAPNGYGLVWQFYGHPRNFDGSMIYHHFCHIWITFVFLGYADSQTNSIYTTSIMKSSLRYPTAGTLCIHDTIISLLYLICLLSLRNIF